MAVIIKTFATPGGKYVYDRETNSILSVSDEEFAACKRVEANEADDNDWKLLKCYTDQKFLQESRLKEILHPATYSLNQMLESRVAHLTLQITTDCSLRCSYCTYSGNYENQRSHSKEVMSIDVMKRSVDFIMERSHGLKKINIAFYGGEPLLEIDIIKSCVRYVKDKYYGREVTYSLTTNGTIFNDDIIHFLRNNDFNISISLDGPKEIHNLNRIFPDGSGSFDKIMDNLRNIRKSYPDYFHKISFMTTVAPDMDYSCINSFYVAEEILNDNSVRSNLVNDYSLKESISYGDNFHMVNAYQRMKVLLAELDLYSKNKTSKLFTNSLDQVKETYKTLSKSRMVEKMHPGGPCVPGVMRPFVDTKGNIFPCERVSENSEVMRLGHIDTGFEYEKIYCLLNIGQLTEKECISCWNFLFCGLCSAACDEGNCFSKEKRLIYCSREKYVAVEQMATICLLLENGYKFEHSVI